MIFSWAIVIGWMGLIFWLSSIPNLNSGLGIWDLILRKLAHMIEYAILTGLLIRAIGRTKPAWIAKSVAVTSVVVALLYAGSDEFHQSFVPGRGPSIFDVGIDLIGIVFAAIFWLKTRGDLPLKKL